MDGITKKEELYEPIRQLELQIYYMKIKWLEKQGWKNSCSYIDSCWRWSKTIKGILYAMNMDEAIDLELKYCTS